MHLLKRNVLNCIGSCYAPLALCEDYREHLREVQREIGFSYIRFHGIFHDAMGLCRSNRKTQEVVYNFQNVFKIYDFFLSVGLKQIVEFGFMPEALASGEQTQFAYKANVTPPKDYSQWADLIEAFLTACIERYGIEEMKTWRYEVWNEPNLPAFWSSDQADYFKLYEVTARAVKGVSADFKVGGPATAKNDWVGEFIDFCLSGEVPVDFVSTHHYCCHGELILERNERVRSYRGQKQMRLDVQKDLDIIKTKSPRPLELHFTEWNVTPAHEDAFGKDSEFTAVFVLKTLLDISETDIDSYSYWTFSDIFEESGPGLYPFTGKYGLISINGIRKPVFYSFKWYSMLCGNVVCRTDETVVTADGAGNFRVLAWNLCEPAEGPDDLDLFGGDWNIDGRDLDCNRSLDVTPGTYNVKMFSISREHGNAYRAWRRMGSPQYLKPEDVAFLKKESEPAVVKDEQVESGGQLNISAVLSPQELTFWEITKCPEQR